MLKSLRGIYFIDLEDGEYKETIKNERIKLEVPMEAAMPCNMWAKKRLTLRETVSERDESNKIHPSPLSSLSFLSKTNKACVHCGNSWIHEDNV